MESQKAKIFVSVMDGQFEFEGPVTFVEAQITRFEEAIRLAISNAKAEKSKTDSLATAKSQLNNPSPSGLESFENLFAVAESGVQLLVDPPGASTANKTVSVALLLTYANLLSGSDSTSFEQIRSMCKTHACLDSSNFSKILKSEKDAFIFGGGTKSQTVKLTVPGRKRAEALANELNSK
ncbi:hypothetical protein [Ferrovibrio sp.]|uniref:hypothetical protein n=1 Tax=Ferrovibrio sp. TaxID=1917215 RepID=UPI003D14D1A3